VSFRGTADGCKIEFCLLEKILIICVLFEISRGGTGNAYGVGIMVTLFSCFVSFLEA